MNVSDYHGWVLFNPAVWAKCRIKGLEYWVVDLDFVPEIGGSDWYRIELTKMKGYQVRFKGERKTPLRVKTIVMKKLSRISRKQQP